MKTTVLVGFQTAIISSSFALFVSATSVCAAPVITSPSDGSTIRQTVLDVQVSVAGIQDVQSVEIRSNGTAIGSAAPTSLFGEWTFPDDSHLSVMGDGPDGQVILDYHPPGDAPMFMMGGTFSDADTFTGSFSHWNSTQMDPFEGTLTINFSFTTRGLLTATIKGESPLGTCTLSNGLSQNENYHFVWNNPSKGKQVLTAVVSYLPPNSTTPATLTSAPVTVTVLVDPPKLPEIVVQQPQGSDLIDGKAKRNFGKVKVGKKSKARVFTIKNTGTANLTGLAITKNGANRANFKVTRLAKTSLAAGASTTFKVTFKPNVKGRQKAAIHIRSNDADENPFDIQLTGKGTQR